MEDNEWVVSFLESKLDVDMKTLNGQKVALNWLKQASPDDMFYTEAQEDRDYESMQMDLLMGQMRRGMMMNVVEEMIASSSKK